MSTKEAMPVQPKKSRIFYKIPRVVPDQKERFYKEDLFRMHAKYTEVKSDRILNLISFDNMRNYTIFKFFIV